MPDAPTRVRAKTEVLCVNDWGKLEIRTPPHTTYTLHPIDLGVPGFSRVGDKLEAGTEFTVPYHLAKFLTRSEGMAFELVE